MASEQAEVDLDCSEKMKRSMKVKKIPWKEFRVEGCGSYVVYEGTCDSDANGCFSTGTAKPNDCERGCLLRQTDIGALDGGEAPPEQAPLDTGAAR